MKGPKILLIGASGDETEDGVRRLEEAGCRVFLAGSGQAALDVVAREKLDAILVDLESPGLDALSVGAELRASGPPKQVPMLGVTSGFGAVLAGALEAGYDGYVAAPVHHASFWREVSSVLRERRQQGSEPEVPDWRLSRGRVLVIEDEESNLELLRFLLEHDGHDVRCAMTGKAGLAMAEEVVPDVVILDVLLPGGIDGYDVCRALKATPALTDIPVLMVSVLLDPRYRLKALTAGANDFLSKPLEAREITLRTRNYVYARRLRLELEDNLRELRRQEQMRDALTQMLIHDLRSPLLGITGYLDVALMGPEEHLSGEGRAFVQRARENTALMERLIGRLLDVARLEAGAFPVEMSEVPVADLVTRAVSIFSERINVDADDTAIVNCDPDLIDRVLANLLTNALSVSPPEESVDLIAQVTNGTFAVQVLDRGPGVDDEDKESIFDKFVQGAATTTHVRSSGLGLTFCRLALEAQGGSIAVRDRPGGGAAFVFQLPRASPTG